MPDPILRLRPVLFLTALSLGACQGIAHRPVEVVLRAITEKPEYGHAHWGFLVVDLKDGEVLLERSADRLFAPASTTKLYSVAAAFEAFGADHRFVTHVYRRGEVDAAGTLAGDLVLRPTGDLTLGGRDDGRGGIAFGRSDHIYARGNPKTELTDAEPLAGLDDLAAQVRAAGIRRVGDVVVDDRYFSRAVSTGSGPQLVTPVMINDNLIDFIIQPAEAGETASVAWRPRSLQHRVESRIRTTRGGTYQVEIRSTEPFHYVLTGSIPAGHPTQIEVMEVGDPVAHARVLLMEALNRQGVAVDASPLGQGSQTPLPPDPSVLPEVAQLTSAPFSEQARLILKVSHNLHASALPLLLAVSRGRRSLFHGMQVQGELLRGLGVPVEAAAFGGAAGGARADMTTPRVTVELLRRVASRPYYRAFRRALPVLGVDGTLHDIARTSPARGSVQAKTGTFYVYDAMNDRRLLTAKALAGYATSRRGRALAFCVIVNNVPLGGRVSAGTVGEDLGQISAAIQQAF